MQIETVFRIRIVYKSGYTHDFECTEFRIKGHDTCNWTPVSDSNRPVMVGLDEIAAVWQIGYRKRIKFFGK